MSAGSLPLLLAIGGPTASGKTELAVWLAEQLEGEIVNADSRQVYRGMDIGTAKPTAEQRARVPHHLLDLVRPDEPFTLSDYVRDAHAAIEAIAARGRLPLLVGGTGLYLRAVVRGYAVPVVPPDVALRAGLEREAAAHGPDPLFERLRALDPEAARRIDVRNVRRVIRALEVCLHLGVPFSSLQAQQPPYRSLVLTLTAPHAMLYARAEQRLQSMLEEGFEAEVAALLDLGYAPTLPAMSALGYIELARCLHGELSREQAIEAIRAGTKGLIRRQLTWFRAEPEARPISIEAPEWPDTALDAARRWLAATPR